MTTSAPARQPEGERVRQARTIRLERRLEVPRWLPVATTIGAIVVALVISGIILWFAGGDPIAIFVHILRSSFGSLGVLSDTLVTATPLILTGLACALAFRMRLWNIGAEGQFLMGAWGASAVLLIPLVPAGTPSIITIPLMMAAGMLAGALYGAIPGILKAYRDVNEIIVTLMLNYIAAGWIAYWVFGPWSEAGFQLTAQFPKSAWLPRLSDFASSVPAFGGLTVHLGLLFGIVAAVVVRFLLFRSRRGYEIRLIGDSPRTARYAGINVARNTVIVFAMSGALAGLAGMSEVAGVVHRLQQAISPGYGFTAIIVAYIAKLHPYGVIIAAIAFGALILAGREIQPSGIPSMIQGIILFCLIASEVV
ncbi:MAG TPA: ABC transporter permease, partial [Candidatus Limnocylindrales bacterium]